MPLAQQLYHLETDGAFRVMTKAKTLKAQGKPIIDMSIGQPDFGPPPHVIEAATKALHDGPHGYGPTPGLEALRQAVCNNIDRRFQVAISPNQVLVTPGAKAAIFYACLAFGEKGADIIYPDPGFLSYRSTIAFTGANPVPLAYRYDDGFALDCTALEALITQRTRLILLNSPSNPTGAVITDEAFKRLEQILERHPNLWIVSDEIYSQMIYPGGHFSSAIQYPILRDRLVVIDGCSKTWGMTGWRVGWMIMPPKLYPHIEKIASSCHSCVNNAAQYGAAAALNGPPQNIMARFDRRRRLFVEGLNRITGVKCPMPSGAFYVFPRLWAYDAEDVQEGLLENSSIACLNGDLFGKQGFGHLRFSIALEEKALTTALKRLKQLLLSYAQPPYTPPPQSNGYVNI